MSGAKTARTYSISPPSSESEAQSDAAFFLLLYSHKYNGKNIKVS
jgi:hypothetical protein